MKKFIPIAIGLITIILISCKKEDINTGKKTGSLTVDIGLLIRDYKVNSGLKASGQTDDFKVIVYKSDGTASIIFETASLMPDTIELAPGNGDDDLAKNEWKAGKHVERVHGRSPAARRRRLAHQARSGAPMHSVTGSDESNDANDRTRSAKKKIEALA